MASRISSRDARNIGRAITKSLSAVPDPRLLKGAIPVKPKGPVPRQKSTQNGFDIVVACVTQHDVSGPSPPGDLRKKTASFVPQRSLVTSATVTDSHFHCDVQLGGKPMHEGLILIRLSAAQLVIEMRQNRFARCGCSSGTPSTHLYQSPRESDAVSATATSNHDSNIAVPINRPIRLYQST